MCSSSKSKVESSGGSQGRRTKGVQPDNLLYSPGPSRAHERAQLRLKVTFFLIYLLNSVHESLEYENKYHCI